jgi:hypothetical protein
MNVGARGQAARLFYQDFFDYSNWQVLPRTPADHRHLMD